MNINVIIPARGGSKRLKDKNIFPIFGKPMIYWAINAGFCLDVHYPTKVWVSSDSSKILEESKKYGANIVLREKSLACDKTFKQAVIRDAALTISQTHPCDVWISLQPNSPEIEGLHLKEAVDLLVKNRKDEIFSVDSNLMQNAAFRVFKGDYVFQKDLSTNCGVSICDIQDVHTIEDIHEIEAKPPARIPFWS